MDEKEVLNLYTLMLENLEKIEENVAKNDWDQVGEILARVDDIEKKIEKSPVPVNTMIAQNASYEKEYSALKEKILDRLQRNTSVIEEWKIKHIQKITGSKDMLHNISRYHKPEKTSYYIDKKE